MVAIAKNFLSGGSGLAPGGSAGNPTVTAAFRDIAEDLADLAGAAPVGGTDVTANALPAFSDPPTAGEMADLRTAVNQLLAAAKEARTIQVARSGVTLRTTAP